MKKRLAHVSPLQLGIVLAVLYALLSLIILVPMGGLSALFFMLRGSQIGTPSPANFGASMFTGVFLLFMPLLYAFFGFLSGVIGGFVYNLVANLTGGIEVTVVDAPEG